MRNLRETIQEPERVEIPQSTFAAVQSRAFCGSQRCRWRCYARPKHQCCRSWPSGHRRGGNDVSLDMGYSLWLLRHDPDYSAAHLVSDFSLLLPSDMSNPVLERLAAAAGRRPRSYQTTHWLPSHHLHRRKDSSPALFLHQLSANEMISCHV